MGGNGLHVVPPRSKEDLDASAHLLREADRAIQAIEVELARLKRAAAMYKERRGKQ